MAHNVNQLLKELENEMSKSSSKKPLEEEEAAKQQQPRALRTDVAHTPTPCATPVSGAVSRTSDQKHSDSTALLVKSMLPPYQSLDQTVPYSMSRQQMQQAKEGSSQSVPAQIHAVREYLGVATDQRNQQAAQEGELLKQQLQAAALNEQQQREFLKQQHLAQKETLAQVAGQHMQQQETRRVYEQQQQQEETRRMYEQQQQEETRRMYEQQQQQAAREQEYFKQQLAHKESQMHNEREYLNQQLLLQQQHQHHQQHALSVHIQAEREHMRQLQQQQPKENLTREIEIVKPRGTPLGASFTLSGLLLAVLPGSPGYHAGLSSLIGQRVTHINGRQLSSYDVIKESDRLVLRFVVLPRAPLPATIFLQ
eukprot:TRINITY_DN31896_c0_g1_i1.p1 TRINITY_DN31896_c0_g1~~TRINITY_DN31896_c0_g1_i1.p1  ORF type:complete len:367 (+),score=110.86 TRINITY_DN31896_c0_g1_i1:74-1174(+)